MNERFFSQRFWQNLLVASISNIVTLVIAVIVSIYISGQIEKLTELSESINTTMQTMLKIVEVGPEGITEVGTAIQDTAGETGEAVGEGAAVVVDRVGNALERFMHPENNAEQSQ